MNMQSISFSRIGSTALVALVLLALAVVPSITRAADLGDYGYGDYYGDFGSSDYGYGDYYGSSDYGYGDYYTPSYDYGYSDSGYSSGYDYVPSSFSYVPYSIPSNSNTNVSSSVYAPTNTCTAPNSCNDNSVFNAPTVVTVTNNDTNTGSSHNHDYNYNHNYNSCTGCGCYNNCYNPPVAYNYSTPYVSLAAAPYTGLDLGPVGTAVYWGFLALWCLAMAYLIAIKRVQVTLFRKLNTFLFGEGESAPVAFAGTPIVAAAPVVTAPAEKKASDSDDFIQSQLYRGRN